MSSKESRRVKKSEEESRRVKKSRLESRRVENISFYRNCIAKVSQTETNNAEKSQIN